MNRQRLSLPQMTHGVGEGGEGDTIDLVGLYVMSKESDALQEGISDESVAAIRKAMQWVSRTSRSTTRSVHPSNL